MDIQISDVPSAQAHEAGTYTSVWVRSFKMRGRPCWTTDFDSPQLLVRKSAGVAYDDALHEISSA